MSDREIDEERLQGFVEKDLLSQKALDWLRERAKIELVPEGSLSKEDDAAEETDDTDPDESQDS